MKRHFEILLRPCSLITFLTFHITAIDDQHLPDHGPFFSVLKTTSYKIVSEGESLGKYIPIYFQDRDEVVPIWLHSKAMDFNTNLLKERVKMILHIILKISDLGKIRFDRSSLELIDELENYAAGVVFDCHNECYRERCWKVI